MERKFHMISLAVEACLGPSIRVGSSQTTGSKEGLLIRDAFTEMRAKELILQLENWKCSWLSHVQLFIIPWTVSPPGSSVHRILQARILEWVAMPSYPRESS